MTPLFSWTWGNFIGLLLGHGYDKNHNLQIFFHFDVQMRTQLS